MGGDDRWLLEIHQRAVLAGLGAENEALHHPVEDLAPIGVSLRPARVVGANDWNVGLDRRIALTLLRQMKVKAVNGVIWAMFAVNIVLSLIIPAANARAAALQPA